ncbi:MAG: GTP-binding protein [Lachnospiraceae bacterium]|nr:GTP-binding protein [Lachnospiraceae bacterium]
MSLQDTPQSERVHISFFGRRNAGKSSLMNAIAGQPVSLVSDIPGTTTDPVRKTMEILPLGPVVLLDTAGLDDEGELGAMRVERTQEVIRETDIALIVLSGKVFLEEWEKHFAKNPALSRDNGDFFLPKEERTFLSSLQKEHIPVFLVLTKADCLSEREREFLSELLQRFKDGIKGVFLCSSVQLSGIWEIKEALGNALPKEREERRIFSGLVSKGDRVILVTPIDRSAPKGRLILPQQLAIRDLLDYHAIPIVTQVEELCTVMESLHGRGKLVVTDSQAFREVERILPKEQPLTSFSILMARYKGFLSYALEGCRILDDLQDGDTVYIAEGCTHHRQCGDIGTEKLPKMLRNYSGKELRFVFSEGKGFLSEEEQKSVRLMIHCGACMLSEREVQSRYQDFLAKGIPICNYGLAMAKMTGILERAVAMLQ